MAAKHIYLLLREAFPPGKKSYQIDSADSITLGLLRKRTTGLHE